MWRLFMMMALFGMAATVHAKSDEIDAPARPEPSKPKHVLTEVLLGDPRTRGSLGSNEDVGNPLYATCKVFLRPDGRVYRVLLGRTIRAGGSCPPSFVDGKLIGTHEIEIAKHDNRLETEHRICILTDKGSCGGVRLLDNPKIPSSTLISVRDTAPNPNEVSGSLLVRPPRGNHLLHPGKAQGFLPYIEGDWSTCTIAYTADGTAWVYNGRTAALSGNCPVDMFEPAKLIGTNEIQVGSMICTMNKDAVCVNKRPALTPIPEYMPNNGTSW